MKESLNERDESLPELAPDDAIRQLDKYLLETSRGENTQRTNKTLAS